jgi:hypothetical protein
MELIAYLLFLLSNNWITALVLSLLVVIAGFGLFAVAWARLKGSEPIPAGGFPPPLSSRIRKKLIALAVIAAFFAAVACFAFSIVNMIFPHLVDGHLITAIGETADARVTSIEATNSYLNKSRVMRHNVIFKTVEGQNYETYFETWDFNIYPSANSTTYPGQGAAFRVAYLPSFPSAFLILTEENSDFTKAKTCSEAQKEFDAARVKFEFDPQEPNYSREFRSALEKLQRLNCVSVTIETPAEAQEPMPAMQR